jgi:4-nitrophenyl phosphatase
VKIPGQQIINSPVATALYLKKQFPQGGNVFIIGESGLVSTLADHGFQHSDKQVLAVVAGMDRDITYTKLAQATLLIRSGVPFIGTNPDRTFPIPVVHQGDVKAPPASLNLLRHLECF